MQLATLKDASPDGRLVVVSRDHSLAVRAEGIAPTLLHALRDWQRAEPALRALAERLERGDAAGAFEFDPRQCAAPLPRSPQWLDGSAFLNHGRLMERAFNTPPIPSFETVPVMYQGASDDFLGPHDDVALPDAADGIDFEGEYGVICGPVPMGVSSAAALGCIRLIVQLNDWSLRALGAVEMKTGFGFLQAKPSTAFAPVAVTPDELGEAWQGGRVCMPLHVTWNGERIGEPDGREMSFHFGALVAHAARTRRLTPGCIVGSGTVSNVARSAGSACLAERRVIEQLDLNEIKTSFMAFDDVVRMQARFADGRDGPFGVIEQRVVPPGT